MEIIEKNNKHLPKTKKTHCSNCGSKLKVSEEDTFIERKTGFDRNERYEYNVTSYNCPVCLENNKVKF